MNPFKSDKCACVTLVHQRDFEIQNYEGSVRTFVFQRDDGYFKVEESEVRFFGMNSKYPDYIWGFPQQITEQEFGRLVGTALHH